MSISRENNTVYGAEPGFPQIKLSYDHIIHKKVYNYNCVLAIPCGVKCIAWFTIKDNMNVCNIMELSNNEVIKTTIYKCCFNSELSFGTIFYGTLVKTQGSSFCTIENIFYYKGKSILHYTWGEKLRLFTQIFKYDITQVAYNNQFIIFSIPLIKASFNELLQEIRMLKYKVQYIQYKFFSDTTHTANTCTKYIYNHPTNTEKDFILRSAQPNMDTDKYITFKVTPDIQPDIYNLYTSDNDGNTTFYDVAYIPDYKTSVMMNHLFRNIKENANLDRLEESDSDDEFENENIDKFVYLNRSYNMNCIYNHKFKKWTPLSISENKQVASTASIKKYY
jgi:hypothetical protein